MTRLRVRSCSVGWRSRIRERGHGRRVVLVVNDAHLLDPQSAALVLHLATSGSSCRAIRKRSGRAAS